MKLLKLPYTVCTVTSACIVQETVSAFARTHTIYNNFSGHIFSKHTNHGDYSAAFFLYSKANICLPHTRYKSLVYGIICKMRSRTAISIQFDSNIELSPRKWNLWDFLCHPVSIRDCFVASLKRNSMCVPLLLALLFLRLRLIVVVIFFFGKFVVRSTVVVLVTDGSHHIAKKSNRWCYRKQLMCVLETKCVASNENVQPTAIHRTGI